MLSYALICVSVICLSVMFCAIFKRGFEQVVPLAVILDILIVYSAGLPGFLKLGVYASIVISFICLFFALFISIGKGKGRDLAAYVFSPGFAVFIIMAAVLYLIAKGASADQSLYSGYVSDTVSLFFGGGSFADVPQPEGIAFQPGYAVFIYMFTALSKEFAAANVLAGAGIFAVSMILPVLGNIQWKNGYLALVIFPVTCAVLFTGGKQLPVFNALSAEAAASLVFAMMLVTYMCCEQCGYVYWTLGFAGAMLCIIRPGAEFLVLLMIVIVAIDIAALGFWEAGEMFAAPSKWLSIVFCVLTIIYSFSSWWIFAGRHGMGRLFDSIQYSAERALGFSGRLGQVFRVFFSGKALIPYILWIVIFAALSVAAAFLAEGFWNRIRTGIQAAIVLLGFVIYLFVIAFAYTYIYPITTNIKDTADMYITAYIIAALVFAVSMAANKLEDRFFTV